jgi:hypothetical protein
MTIDALWVACGQNHSGVQPFRKGIGHGCLMVHSKSSRLTLARIMIPRPPCVRRCRTGRGEYASGLHIPCHRLL